MKYLICLALLSSVLLTSCSKKTAEQIIKKTAEAIIKPIFEIPSKVTECLVKSIGTAISPVKKQNRIELSLSHESIDELTMAIEKEGKSFNEIGPELKASTSEKTYNELKLAIATSYFDSEYRALPLALFEFYVADLLNNVLRSKTISLPAAYKIKLKKSPHDSDTLLVKISIRGKKKENTAIYTNSCEEQKKFYGISEQSIDLFRYKKQSFLCDGIGYTPLLAKPYTVKKHTLSLKQKDFKRAIIAAKKPNVQAIIDLKQYLNERSYDHLVREIDSLETAHIFEASKLALETLKSMPDKTKLPIESYKKQSPVSIEFDNKKFLGIKFRKKSKEDFFICP